MEYVFKESTMKSLHDICLTGVYRCVDVDKEYKRCNLDEFDAEFGRTSKYDCRNWTFRPHIYMYDDETYLLMTDTYESIESIVVDESNCDNFELMFDMADHHLIDPYRMYFYNVNDIIPVALNSRGWQKPYYVVSNKAKPSIDNAIVNTDKMIKHVSKRRDTELDTINQLKEFKKALESGKIQLDDLF